MLREHGDAVEADLSRYHQIDYRDRWRFDADGRRRLTLRMILVRVRHLPINSATSIAQGSPGWLLADYLAADLFHAMAGAPHPALPAQTVVQSPERVKKIYQAKQRAAARRRAIEAGDIA